MGSKKIFTWANVGWAVLGILIAIQLIPVSRANPSAQGQLQVSGGIAELLETACMDCHSNQTVWPWYSYVAPVSWLVAHDVEEGREHLNFSIWGTYNSKQKDHMLEEIAEVVEEGEMPMPIYTITHGDANLKENQRNKIVSWANSLRMQNQLQQQPW